MTRKSIIKDSICVLSALGKIVVFLTDKIEAIDFTDEMSWTNSKGTIMRDNKRREYNHSDPLSRIYKCCYLVPNHILSTTP